MHWVDCEQGMLLVLGGALLSLISAIVPYLKHDIKPDCQSKPKQIWLGELQKKELGVCPALKQEAFDITDRNLVSVNCSVFRPSLKISKYHL